MSTMLSTPIQYDAMAGDILGAYSYTSQHHGDDEPPSYVAHMPAYAAHKNHGHVVKARPAHDVTYTGEQMKAAFRAKHGYVYEGHGSA